MDNEKWSFKVNLTKTDVFQRLLTTLHMMLADPCIEDSVKERYRQDIEDICKMQDA